jgi:hypothetical protein
MNRTSTDYGQPPWRSGTVTGCSRTNGNGQGGSQRIGSRIPCACDALKSTQERARLWGRAGAFTEQSRKTALVARWERLLSVIPLGYQHHGARHLVLKRYLLATSVPQGHLLRGHSNAPGILGLRARCWNGQVDRSNHRMGGWLLPV